MTSVNAVVTYNSLITDITRYLERGFSSGTDPTVLEQIPRLITLAERRVARDLKLQGFQNQATIRLTKGVAVYPKPDRWRDTVSINIGTGPKQEYRKQIYLRAYEYCRQMYPVETDLGEPEYFCDYDYTLWLFVPAPDDNYPIEVLYYELPPLLEPERQQNWLTRYAPNVLLYACLLEATPFLKNDDRIQVWMAFYQDAVKSLKEEDVGKILNRGAIRSEA